MTTAIDNRRARRVAAPGVLTVGARPSSRANYDNDYPDVHPPALMASFPGVMGAPSRWDAPTAARVL
jgi:hypothetical protein